ncbi:MAG: GDP-L-fucose synthase family protein [Candidatus Promineifilaceae bacterium]
MSTQTGWPNRADFWQGKRVIVTGGAGFLGSFVVEKLRDRGAAEIIIPRSSEYDLVQQSAIKQLFNDTKDDAGNPVDMVIHLAARVGGIGANLVHQAEYFYDNLMMGVQLIHEAYSIGIPKFVAIGTICAYPKFAPIPFKEADIWDGYPEETNAPYGLAKKMMLVQSQVYRSQYGYNSIYLLPVNLYGPRDNFDLETGHVIPMLVRKCLEAQARGDNHIEAWGDGSPTREFLYVEEAAEGILMAAERYNDSEPVNLGSSFEISIKDLVETVARVSGFEGEVRWDLNRPNGQPRRKLDVSFAEESFGFRSAVSFEDGLRSTIDWYIENNS